MKASDIPSSPPKQPSQRWKIFAIGFIAGTLFGISLPSFQALEITPYVTTASSQSTSSFDKTSSSELVSLSDKPGTERNNTLLPTGTTNTKREQESPSLPPLNHPKWCPKAKCNNTELCHPCQQRFLILVSTPRAGSTTLTWMLDSLPGIRMSGENGNTLGLIKNMMDNVLGSKHFIQGAGKKSSWGHNYVPPQSQSCVSQSMIKTINPPLLNKKDMSIKFPNSTLDIVGFKTIRLYDGVQTTEDEKQIINFVTANFPCSRLVVNINSDIERQVISMTKAFGYDKSAESMERTRSSIQIRTARLTRLARIVGPERAFLMDSKEWTTDISIMNSLVDWLGFGKACHFNELLEFNTGNKKGYGNGRTRFKNLNWTDCKALSFN